MENDTVYDLEERTFSYAKQVLKYINSLNKTLANVEIAKQLIRSAGSVGANYIEANESFSRKDFIYRIKICRKEAKESNYWLRLLSSEEKNKKLRENLIDESWQLTKIFGSIVYKNEGKN